MIFVKEHKFRYETEIRGDGLRLIILILVSSSYISLWDNFLLMISTISLIFVIDYAEEKRQVLEEETKMMLAKAKQAARMQMEIEKINTNRFTTAILPKASRFSYRFVLAAKNENFNCSPDCYFILLS